MVAHVAVTQAAPPLGWGQSLTRYCFTASKDAGGLSRTTALVMETGVPAAITGALQGREDP
jgi:hypothetical protein